jgi:hypothetical protein
MRAFSRSTGNTHSSNATPFRICSRNVSATGHPTLLRSSNQLSNRTKFEVTSSLAELRIAFARGFPRSLAQAAANQMEVSTKATVICAGANSGSRPPTYGPCPWPRRWFLPIFQDQRSPRQEAVWRNCRRPLLQAFEHIRQTRFQAPPPSAEHGAADRRSM